MALSQRLQLRQSQSLVMTPQLMQAIKLLQLSNLDLIAYVEAELERNPLLERDEAGDSPEPAEPGEDHTNRAEGKTNGEEFPGWGEAAEATQSKSAVELENVFPDDHARPNEPPQPPPAEGWSSPPSRQ